MSRQTVHLSESAAAAREVGRRHAADPVVFVVDATAMQSDDRRIVKRGTETYTTTACRRCTFRCSRNRGLRRPLLESDVPVIASGRSIAISVSIVGARSASVPPSRAVRPPAVPSGER